MGGWSRRNGGNCDRQSGRSVVGSRLLDLGIAVMDKIYERPYFAMVAARGHDANNSLPGVRKDSRRQLIW